MIINKFWTKLFLGFILSLNFRVIQWAYMNIQHFYKVQKLKFNSDVGLYIFL
jgi:hypothetical protein